MTALLALATFAFLPSADPVVLPTRMAHGIFSVRAEVGGKEGWFLLGTSSSHSYVGPGFLKVGAADYTEAPVKVGGQELGSTYVGIDRAGAFKAMNVDGVLGTDVLDNCALGLDYAEGKVAFWREGRLERSAAEAWTGAEARVDRVRGWMENGSLSINVKFAGQEVLVGITPDIPYTILAPKTAALAKGVRLYSTYGRRSSTDELVPGIEGRFTAAFGRGDLPPTYLQYFALPDAVGDETSVGEGVLNPRDLNASRVIFDLPGRCLWVPQVAPRIQASRALSRLFEIPLDLKEDAVAVGPLWTTATSSTPWDPWVGTNVRRFGDQEPALLLKSFATPGKTAESTVAQLYPLLRKGISVELEGGGKEGLVKTPPLRIPGE
ncbi:MAG: hypothetical protein ACO1SV_27110 [Fimbriimonas sp.]